MSNDNYRNYIKHLGSIVRTYEEAPKANDVWLFESDAHGILARAETAIRKVCGDESPYKNRMDTVLEMFGSVRVKADLIVGS